MQAQAAQMASQVNDNPQVVAELIKVLQKECPWYRDVEVAWHESGKLKHVKIQYTSIIRYPVYIATFGLGVYLFGPIVLYTLAALVELCLVEVGLSIVTAIIASYAGGK
jgi:hypothetical protein